MANKKVTIWFDMDGTIADLYNVDNWLERLDCHDPTPYMEALVMLKMSTLARLLHKAQAKGYGIGVISWLAKHSNESYDKAVEQAKRNWLKVHLPSVEWDAMYFVKYGTPKHEIGSGLLFDDNAEIRKDWTRAKDENFAVTPEQIIGVLKAL